MYTTCQSWRQDPPLEQIEQLVDEAARQAGLAKNKNAMI